MQTRFYIRDGCLRYGNDFAANSFDVGFLTRTCRMSSAQCIRLGPWGTQKCALREEGKENGWLSIVPYNLLSRATVEIMIIIGRAKVFMPPNSRHFPITLFDTRVSLAFLSDGWVAWLVKSAPCVSLGHGSGQRTICLEENSSSPHSDPLTDFLLENVELSGSCEFGNGDFHYAPSKLSPRIAINSLVYIFDTVSKDECLLLSSPMNTTVRVWRAGTYRAIQTNVCARYNPTKVDSGWYNTEMESHVPAILEECIIKPLVAMVLEYTGYVRLVGMYDYYKRVPDLQPLLRFVYPTGCVPPVPSPKGKAARRGGKF